MCPAGSPGQSVKAEAGGERDLPPACRSLLLSPTLAVMPKSKGCLRGSRECGAQLWQEAGCTEGKGIEGTGRCWRRGLVPSLRSLLCSSVK